MLSIAWRSKNKELDKKIIVYINRTRYAILNFQISRGFYYPYFFGVNPRRKHPWKISHSQGPILA